jgi:transcriptional regulator with XRE-family HTH domain
VKHISKLVTFVKADRKFHPVLAVPNQKRRYPTKKNGYFTNNNIQPEKYLYTMSTATKPKHIGRNISRIRELRGMKQEALAIAIGVSQQTISSIENSETVEEDKLILIAKELGVTTEAIKNFTDEAVFNYFSNFYDSSTGQVNHNNCTFNPLDKVIELYERLVQAEKDKVTYLEKLFKDK